MRVFIYQDGTLSLPLGALVDLCRQAVPALQIDVGVSQFEISAPRVDYPAAYEGLPVSLKREVAGVDLAFMGTAKPYWNNYFWEIFDNQAIVSLFGWEHLTDLPEENGFLYFLVSHILDRTGFLSYHEENTGCINDFWWDKTGVDGGMRAAFLCRDCRETDGRVSAENVAMREQLEDILSLISEASRRGLSVVDYWQGQHNSHKFDTFVCYNSEDVLEAGKVASALAATGLRPWMDIKEVRPGASWVWALSSQIDDVASSIVCVGPAGIGPWQRQEIAGLLTAFVEQGKPVIPVLLAPVHEVPRLPFFLQQFRWVDASHGLDAALPLLQWGITGVSPGGSSRLAEDSP